MADGVTTRSHWIRGHKTWTRGGPATSHLPDDDVHDLEERRTVSLGEPGAMALFGFATGTWMAGIVVGGVFGIKDLGFVAPVLVVFAGIAQYIAGVVAFNKNNGFAATAFCCYGANNTVIGFFVLLQAVHVLPMTGPAAAILGYELLSFGFISLGLGLAAIPMNLAYPAILLPLAAGFILAGIPDVAGKTPAFQQIGYIGGYLLIASAGVAYFVASALVLNSSWRRRVLPMFGKP